MSWLANSSLSTEEPVLRNFPHSFVGDICLSFQQKLQGDASPPVNARTCMSGDPGSPHDMISACSMTWHYLKGRGGWPGKGRACSHKSWMLCTLCRTQKKWWGPKQFEDPSKELMMLPTDLVRPSANGNCPQQESAGQALTCCSYCAGNASHDHLHMPHATCHKGSQLYPVKLKLLLHCLLKMASMCSNRPIVNCQSF